MWCQQPSGRAGEGEAENHRPHSQAHLSGRQCVERGWDIFTGLYPFNLLGCVHCFMDLLVFILLTGNSQHVLLPAATDWVGSSGLPELGVDLQALWARRTISTVHFREESTRPTPSELHISGIHPSGQEVRKSRLKQSQCSKYLVTCYSTPLLFSLFFM